MKLVPSCCMYALCALPTGHFSCLSICDRQASTVHAMDVLRCRMPRDEWSVRACEVEDIKEPWSLAWNSSSSVPLALALAHYSKVTTSLTGTLLATASSSRRCLSEARAAAAAFLEVTVALHARWEVACGWLPFTFTCVIRSSPTKK